MCSDTALTMSNSNSGWPIRAAPAHTRVTLGAGQPKLRSMILACGSSKPAAVTMSSRSPPKIWGMKGSSIAWVSMRRHEVVASRVSAVEFVNSVMARLAPHSRASNRKGRSVTPAMGASISDRGSPSHGPIGSHGPMPMFPPHAACISRPVRQAEDSVSASSMSSATRSMRRRVRSKRSRTRRSTCSSVLPAIR